MRYDLFWLHIGLVGKANDNSGYRLQVKDWGVRQELLGGGRELKSEFKIKIASKKVFRKTKFVLVDCIDSTATAELWKLNMIMW